MSESAEYVVAALFIVFGAVFGYLEATGLYNAPYSKFQEDALTSWLASTGRCVPRRAFTCAYLGGLIVCLSAFWEYGTRQSPYHVVAGGFLIGQQIKRLCEVRFVHRYSGQLTMGMAVVISLTNLAVTVACTHAVLHRPPFPAEDRFRALAWPIPLVLLAWSGNHYHHWILAKLRPLTPIRRYNAEEAYRIPARGWFLRATCPHYYFETLAWLAFALIVHRPAVYGVAIATGLYLAGRSWRTRAWYYRHIDGFTPGLSCMIPFAF